MTQLSHAQMNFLIAAAGAENGGIDAPDDRRVAGPLLKHGYMIRLPKTEGPSRLLITAAGCAVIALEPAPEAQAAEPFRQETVPAARTPKGKLGEVIALLQRPDGASLDDLIRATGWQAHSVRGVMSGAIKKKLGHAIRSEVIEGARRYRIVAEPAA